MSRRPMNVVVIARAPGACSLAELFAAGLLTDDDVLPGGFVDEAVRTRAEDAYAAATRAGRATVGGVPPRRPRTSVRRDSRLAPAATRRPRSAASSTSAASTTLVVGPTSGHSVAHVHRVRIRAHLGDDAEAAERLPKPLDVCCICLARDREFAFVPCYHFCVCRVCSARVTRCPLCRDTPRGVQRIHV